MKRSSRPVCGRLRATLWLLQVLAIAVGALVFAGTRTSSVHGLARIAVSRGAATGGRPSRVAASPGIVEQWQRLPKHTLRDRAAFEADVADEDVDERERDDDREHPCAVDAAIALRRTGAPREPGRVTRVALERDPSRFAIGRGISRGPPV